jgi:hypothetical protein
MITKKTLSKRITELQVELRDLDRAYKVLLDERARNSKEIRDRFTSELAQYRSAVQATQTDRIKFGVLEEWISEVFKLNNLKFSDKDFIQKSEEQLLRDKIAKEIEAWEVVEDSTNMNPEVFKFLKETFASVVRGEK